MRKREEHQFKPVDPGLSPRFAGVKTFMRLPYSKITNGIDFAIVGVPFDGGASFRTGQRTAPEAIRSMSALLRRYNPALDVSIFEDCCGIDYGDVAIVPGYIEETYTRIAEELSPLINTGVVPFVLGGDHSITLPELRAIAKKHEAVALVHFDAHNDMEENYFGKPHYHGTPFRRAVEENLLSVEHSIQIGIRGSLSSKDELEIATSLGFKVIPMAAIRERGIAEVIQTIHERVGKMKVFVSFDIDIVDPAYAPGTGIPEVGGLTSWEALTLVRGLQGLQIVGGDLVEVLPAYDPSAITAFLAANIVYEWISLLALMKQPGT